MAGIKNGDIYIGTSGFSYSSWKRDFYLEGMQSRDYLAFYAQRYNTVEINSTFYHTPAAARRWKLSLAACRSRYDRFLLYEISWSQQAV